MNFTKLNLLVAISFFVLITSCNEKKQTKIELDIKTISEKLLSISKQENADFYKKNVAIWGKHFVHTPQVYWICVEGDVTLRANGWDDLNKFVGDWMKENPVPESDASLKQDVIEDFQSEITSDLAFVRYVKNHKKEDGSMLRTLESRTFKLVDNEWKIISLVAAPGYDSPNSTKNIFIHTASN